tara:strand:+ start:861 stop:1676 length:816 start_codon:yes stop_codon:yes gene_type:complete
MKTNQITSKNNSLSTYFKNVYKYNFLIYVLAKKETKTFYANTYLGFIWLIIQPLFALIIYTIFFYLILGIETLGVPYPLFVFPGVMVWFQFIQIIYDTGSSITNNQTLIHKISFPKLILPLSKIVYSLVSVSISFILIIIISLYYGYVPTMKIFLFPIILLLNIMNGFCIGVWVSALTIKYSDLQNIIPFLCNFLIWISPVFYPTSIIPENLEYILYYNPITTVLALYRWCLIDIPLPASINFFSLIPVFIILISGILYFKKIDDDIADYI